jgi:hypothetical protein
MPAPTRQPDPLVTLMSAALIVGCFRRRLRDAGYVFREPPGVDALIADIDLICCPDEAKAGRGKGGDKGGNGGAGATPAGVSEGL